MKMTPARYKAAGLEKRHGQLVFIPGPRAGVAYLIAKNVTVRGDNERGVASRRKGKGRVGREFVVMFILIRRTRRDKRFDPATLARSAASKAPAYMREYLTRSRGGAMNFGRPIYSTAGGGNLGSGNLWRSVRL